MRRLAAISVDLDEIACYAAIHGLEVAGGAHAVYDRALPRLAELFEREGVRATFFVIGSDLARVANAGTIRRLHEAGHEIASHSQSHFYDLTRRGRPTIEAEIREGGDAIARATGKRPVGFRAPGYTITDEVLEVLEQQGYAYDSSVFPCPSYYAAKRAAIAVIRARGRTSRSIVDDPRVLTAPADPYRRGTPYWKRGGGILELPIGVTRGARLPYIGTYVVAGGAAGARALTEQMVGRPFVNLELHGIDLADAGEDDLGWLRPHQLDLRRSVATKSAALRTAIATLRKRGYELVTIEAAARALAG